MHGDESGLAEKTLRNYRYSKDLERDSNTREPMYYHRPNCDWYCDYECNGERGFQIAIDIETIELSDEDN